ncbi:MAG: rod shape-determining protein RodA [Bacteroidales bacterium]|nr:rod shape-determining protein RodA [Bacteroidales bacterium]
MNQDMSSYRKGVDWVTVLLYAFLVVFGWCNLYAANYNPEVGLQFSFDAQYAKQLMWVGISVVCIGVIMLSDSKVFVEFAWILYVTSLLMLVIVLAVGHEVYGAKSWIKIGPVLFQPAEFTKIGAALVVARIMSRYGFSFTFRNYVKLFAVLLIPMTLIILQNDTGSALVYVVLILAMFREGLSPHFLLIGATCAIVAVASLLLDSAPVLTALVLCAFVAVQVLVYRQSAPWEAVKAFAAGAVAALAVWLLMRFHYGRELLVDYYLLIGMAVASLFLILAYVVHRFRGLWWLLAYVWVSLCTSFGTGYVFDNVLGDHQRTRINVLFGIEEDPLGAGYNVNQSLIAIGSGGVFGKGFLNGTQTKLDFVPKQTTDFIFCTVGEEWGFLGCVVLVSAYIFLFLRIIYLAERQHSVFSRVYGYCVASIFFFHFAINVSMAIGLMPVIGIPLPFFSYGGSSFWGFTILLFIFVKLDTDRNFLVR